MPDGSIAQPYERTEFDSECRRMHARLVDWGLINKESMQLPEEEEDQAKHRVWTPRQREEARMLNRLVIQLEPQERLVLMTFYSQNVAGRWYEPQIVDIQRKIEREDLTPMANERIERYARDAGVLDPEQRNRWRIGHWQFPLIRERAIRQLVVAEATLPRPKGLHPCG